MANKRHVFGIYEVPQAAELAVDELLCADFAPDAITVLFRDNEDSREFADRKNTRPPHGTDYGKAASQPLEGSWGLLEPGIGPTEGALPGALKEMGIPAEWSDGSLLDGKVLVSVECCDAEDVMKARALLRTTGAKDTDTSSVKK